jgi:FKBP-type peptidyl-prolyl cis-trans isomerase FkpA
MRTKVFFLFLILTACLAFNSSCKKQIQIYDYYGHLAEDGKIIDKYLADSNITALTSTSGLRYVIHNPGFGTYPRSGNTVRLNYRGSLLDGTVFESSFDNQVPYEFVVGYGSVISGMEEGVQYIAEGGSITIYIPSPLGYKDQAAGTLIKPNSILIFYMELLKVQ